MSKAAVSNKIKRTSIILLLFSVLALILNSFLPIVILKNPDNPDKLVYFNIESMPYSQNIDIQNLYYNLNLINILIWITIILLFTAFFGVIIYISEIYEKISFLFLTIGCLSIIFSSITCYQYIIFILKVNKFDNILLAYISVEQLRYSYIILINIIVMVLASISYIIITIPFLYRNFKDSKSNKQELTIEKPVTKSFSPTIEQINYFNNKKLDTNEDFYFKNKKESIENWLSNEMNIKETNEKLDTSYIKKETMDEQNNTYKNVEYSDEKKSPFSEEYKIEKPKQKKDETDDVKISELFKKTLFSAIDKKKKEELTQSLGKKSVELEKKDLTEPIKFKDNKKYIVKCPECSYAFTKEKNEDSTTKIICPKCGKEGTIK